FLQ
ncbi:hypothetical protein CP061683_1389B, partial [Chlamydia psittaci 06-1683]